jgi:hypothetical protein
MSGRRGAKGARDAAAAWLVDASVGGEGQGGGGGGGHEERPPQLMTAPAARSSAGRMAWLTQAGMIVAHTVVGCALSKLVDMLAYPFAHCCGVQMRERRRWRPERR